jgi:thiosulfate/3-mercaptopyruvate sulfurtransferase
MKRALKLMCAVAVVVVLAAGCKSKSLFVTSDWLASNMTKDAIVIIDANNNAAYTAGHIPGAINVWYEDFNDTSLQLNLLPPATLAEKLGAKGLDGTQTYVIYGEAPFFIGRISWMLDYLGCKNIFILDGGLTKWKKENRETTTETTAVQAKTFTFDVNDAVYATTDEVLAGLDDPNAVIIDVRTDEEYNGWQLSKEPRPGHITGAIHLPITSWFKADKTIKSVDELTSMFKAAGVNKWKNLIFYCTIGGRSGLGPELAKKYLHYTFSSSNYDGSIREWGQDANRPMEAGFVNFKLLYPAKYVNSNLATLKIIDCRSEEDYTAGHIPGAIHLMWQDLDNNGDLRPNTEIATILGNHGITGEENETLLIYTTVDGSWGADGRLFWALEYMGHKDVHILNGGWKAWVDSGYATETTVNTPDTETYTGTVTASVLATTDYVEANLHAAGVKIIDTRADEALYGAARGGRIPGAVHYNYDNYFDPDWTLKDHNQLQATYTALGVTSDKTAIFYCAVGIRSGFGYFTLRLLGYPSIRNYDGSWNAWAADSSLPIE